MKQKQQQPGKWLDEAVHQLELLCREAAQFDGEDEFVAPTSAAFESAKAFMKELQKADIPVIGLTQDGEIVLSWSHASDKFKAIVRSDGSLALFQNKKKVELSAFARRLTSVPA
ncbi:MAG: hypothetical protein JST01_09885 [Cyanobacteria bacterium SZAS TMP-1]|nr:hypothetical protein [Cyanobacteria bacterium SZAS TMP-1]